MVGAHPAERGPMSARVVCAPANLKGVVDAPRERLAYVAAFDPAGEQRDALVADLSERRHEVVICNFANADMVGHTGSMEATVAAVETLDACLGRILHALEGANGAAIVTADHGNAEQMWDDELNAPHTAHTSNPVPVILCHEAYVGGRLRDGALRDVAPTMLDLLGIPTSGEMTGRTLIDK